MEVQVEDPAQEIKRLQRCINDLVSLLTLPALWRGSEPAHIVQTLLDVLLRMLSLDFAYARLSNLVDAAPVEILRVAEHRKSTPPNQELHHIVRNLPAADPQSSLAPIRSLFGTDNISIFTVPLGLEGEIGMILLGSDRPDFPEGTESLLMSVAANQASIGLQEARLLGEQKRIANELDQRVAERTAELTASNEELKKEIAERKLAEERRTQSEEALAKARSELANVARITTLGVLTASIAHEVNQPLSGIITNASTCLRMLSSEPPNLEGARETARRTIRDGNRASNVITRLRTLYSKKEPTLELMDLNEAAQEVVALSTIELQRSQVMVRQELAPDLPPVRGDRVQLQQVILNLLRNASDAMSMVQSHPKELLMKTERDNGDSVRLSVKDAGVGFGPQGPDKLFQPFYTTKGDGMGIGLSLSRSIIEAHQGRLWAQANEGPGATFCFSIPCEPGSNAESLRDEPQSDAA